MVAVLGDFFDVPLETLDLLNVGGSAGAIDDYLADYFKTVVGVDIDSAAIEHAKSSFSKENLSFQEADALDLPFEDESFDVVICSHVYEHVPDPEVMFAEIHRVTKPNGACYFSAGNRLMWNEPHYNLPLLSVLPRPLAHLYIRLAKKADFYHEKHLTYWGLKKIVSDFDVKDYTVRLIEEPTKFHTEYMISPHSLKGKLARLIAKAAFWALPGYIWMLRK